MLNKLQSWVFYILFFLTPLLWAPINFELFEYNKMMFVYLLTVISLGLWLIRMVSEKRLILKKTPFDIPILLFLLANILSTIFSIDPHLSIWGYYSRSNGGLLSTISYIALYYILVSNFSQDKVIPFLKSALFGGIIVALWAIPEHFGSSPSCLIITGKFNDACWIQDVQARVFATLGQPNWLAAYLAMLIFPVFYFLTQAKNWLNKLVWVIVGVIYYLAFTFTDSRAGFLGLGVGIVYLIFTEGWLIYQKKTTLKTKLLEQKSWLILLMIFIILTLVFNTTLSRFAALIHSAPPATPSSQGAVTQLESGGTESGQIRLIVWQGALDIFKHYPIFGSGVETFADSYYQFRPADHNLTSEWDFLYNKAHNEYLNYLSTTGLFGFVTYMAIIGAFSIWVIKKLLLLPKQKTPNTQYWILNTLFASYLSYLVQNFFGFSVVIIAVFFFLFPGLAFLETDDLKPLQLPKLVKKILKTLANFLYSRSFYSKFGMLIIVVLITLGLYILLTFYIADTYFAKGYQADQANNPGRAYNNLSKAVLLNPNEPFYQSELAYAAAGSAVGLADQDATLSAMLKQEAIQRTSQVLENNPNNVSYFRTAVRTYYLLSTIDKTFTQKSLDTLDQAIKLAPTDPKLTYNKAILLSQENKDNDAIAALLKTIALKPDYRDAYYALGLLYFETGKKQDAISQMKTVLKLIPGDPDASEKLKEWSPANGS